MQELQFHVRGYKVKHFTLVRSDLCCQRQFCSSKWKGIVISRTDHHCCWGDFKGITELFKSQMSSVVAAAFSFLSLVSSVDRRCWCGCPFFTWQGDRGFGQKCCVVDELQKSTWTLLSFSVIPAPNFPSFYGRCNFFSVHWVISAMMRLLYFFLSLEGLPQISLGLD